jgi:hypothetical protein
MYIICSSKVLYNDPLHKCTNHIPQWCNETISSFNAFFVFMHTNEANYVSAYDLYIYAKNLWEFTLKNMVINNLLARLNHYLVSVGEQFTF